MWPWCGGDIPPATVDIVTVCVCACEQVVDGKGGRGALMVLLLRRDDGSEKLGGLRRRLSESGFVRFISGVVIGWAIQHHYFFALLVQLCTSGDWYGLLHFALRELLLAPQLISICAWKSVLLRRVGYGLANYYRAHFGYTSGLFTLRSSIQQHNKKLFDVIGLSGTWGTLFECFS